MDFVHSAAMKLLTTSEVAERLGVHRSRVHALIKSGRIPAHKYGVVWLVDEADIHYQKRKPGRPRKHPAPPEQPLKSAA